MGGIPGMVWKLPLVLLVASSVLAGPIEEANEHYLGHRWDESAAAYRSLAKEQPDNGLFKYRLAVSLRHQGRHEEALGWLDEARGGAVPDSYIELERARALTAAGQSEEALGALNAAAEAGFANAGALGDDAVLQTLAGSPRFTEALEKMEKNSAPCEHIEEFSQFDFWLGRWRVVDPSGTFQGTNTIEKTQGGCLIMEHWTGASGVTGTSMNFYDGRAKQWVQIWVSPGLQLEIRGGLVDGAMALVGKAYYIETGDDYPFRGTWTPMEGGVVRQHFEQSTDGGETWTTWFDGRYHRMTEEEG